MTSSASSPDRVFRAFRSPGCRMVLAAWLCIALLLQSATAVAPGPAWWGTQTVLDPYAVADDFAVANAGQLKYFAAKAAAAMEAELPGGAGAAINALVAGWNAPPAEGVTRDNYLAVNQGQLKYVAAPFYDRLGLPYPWAGGSGTRNNYLLVNLGQLKQVFSFALNFRTVGQEAAQIPDAILLAAQNAWNALVSQGEQPVGSSTDDFDGDGISNLQEYLMGNALFDPLDLDGDRIPDSIEDAHPGILSKLNFADAVWDHDANGSVEYVDSNWVVLLSGDGVMNYEELLLELNLNAATTSGRADGLGDAEVLAWGLAAGQPLAISTDAVAALWGQIDADWLSEHYLENYSNWLDATTGLAAFRTDVFDNFVWQPEVWSIESPGLAYDMNWNTFDADGDGAADLDRDYDGLPDLWEYRYVLNPRDGHDAAADPDGDTLTNLQEYAAGTNPRLADSDGDGFSDGEELAQLTQGADPLNGAVGLPLMLTKLSNAMQYVGTGGRSTPLMVKVTQGGQPVFGATVEFAVSNGSGLLQSNTVATTPNSQVTLTTDANGTASVTYLAEAMPGSGGVTAALTGAGSQSVNFNLSILAGLADSGSISSVRPWDGEVVPPAPEPDADGDGIPDKWEIAHDLDPLASNAGQDSDSDGYSDYEEFMAGGDPLDAGSRPGPALETRYKSYDFHYTYTTQDPSGLVMTTFYGEAHLIGGEDYLYESGWDGSFLITNSADLSADMRAAFEAGSYNGTQTSGLYLFDYAEDYVTTSASYNGDPSGPNWGKDGGGEAMELRITDPTITNAPAMDWSRSYLVMEYGGAQADYTTFDDLPLKNMLGSLTFSRTADGTKSVTFSGDANGQVKISGNDRVEIIPNEVMGQTSKLELVTVEKVSRDKYFAGSITIPSSWNDLELEFVNTSSSENLGKYGQLDGNGTTKVYNSVEEVLDVEGTNAGEQPENQQVWFIRDPQGANKINWYTCFNDLGNVEVKLYLGGAQIGSIQHQLVAEDDFAGWITYVDQWVKGTSFQWQVPLENLPLPAQTLASAMAADPAAGGMTSTDIGNALISGAILTIQTNVPTAPESMALTLGSPVDAISTLGSLNAVNVLPQETLQIQPTLTLDPGTVYWLADSTLIPLTQAQMEELLPQADSIRLAAVPANQGDGAAANPTGGGNASPSNIPEDDLDNLTRACLIPVFLVISQVEGLEAVTYGTLDGFKSGLEDDYQMLALLGKGLILAGDLTLQGMTEIRSWKSDRKKRAEAIKMLAKHISEEFVFKPMAALNQELSTWEGFKRRAFITLQQAYDLQNQFTVIP